jgi:hypothetical protein
MRDKKFYEVVSDKLQSMGRFDLKLGKAIKVKDAIKMGFTYDVKLGIPLKSDVKAFFSKHLPELEPRLETAVKKDNIIVLFASEKKETRKVAEKTKMKEVIAGLQYMDSDMGTVWTVVKDEKGNQVLQQTNSYDVLSLVEERARRMGLTPKQKVNVSAAVANLGVGDVVKFWLDNKTYKGIVQNITDDKVVVNENGNETTISKDAVYKIVEPAKSKENVLKESQEKYWTEVFGPKYAKDLVKE